MRFVELAHDGLVRSVHPGRHDVVIVVPGPLLQALGRLKSVGQSQWIERRAGIGRVEVDLGLVVRVDGHELRSETQGRVDAGGWPARVAGDEGEAGHDVVPATPPGEPQDHLAGDVLAHQVQLLLDTRLRPDEQSRCPTATQQIKLVVRQPVQVPGMHGRRPADGETSLDDPLGETQGAPAVDEELGVVELDAVHAAVLDQIGDVIQDAPGVEAAPAIVPQGNLGAEATVEGATLTGVVAYCMAVNVLIEADVGGRVDQVIHGPKRRKAVEVHERPGRVVDWPAILVADPWDLGAVLALGQAIHQVTKRRLPLAPHDDVHVRVLDGFLRQDRGQGAAPDDRDCGVQLADRASEAQPITDLMPDH